MNKPKFSFMAHSAKPEDKTGTATWEYEVRGMGEWKPATACARFDSFGHACQIDSIIKAAYERGEAAGYAAAQAEQEPKGEAVRVDGYSCAKCGCADMVRAEQAEQSASVPVAFTEEGIDEYVDGYVMECDSSMYTPTSDERLLIKDAIMGLIGTEHEQQFNQSASATSVQPVAWRITDGEGGYDYTEEAPNEFNVNWARRYGRKHEPLYAAPTPQGEKP